MLLRLVAAVLRAGIIVLVVCMPSLMLAGTTREGAELVVVLALALGLFTVIEYSACYPAMIEFRDAPPFNRVRLLSLAIMLFCLSLVAGGDHGSSLVLVLNALGILFGQALDFPASPLAALIAELPDAAAPVSAVQVKIMAGLAIFTALSALCVFAILLRTEKWPQRGQAFNVWVNLPTFDPTTGGDVIARLNRDAHVNLLFAIAMAVLFPTIGLIVAEHLERQIVTSAQALVWGIALWMFLPLSLMMRALAMMRIATMIRDRRALLVAAVAQDGAQPV